MADVNISKFRASVVRDGSKPASPGFVVSEGQSPTDPAGSGQNHLPVTIAAAATGLAITESQILSGAGTVGQYIRGDGSLADFPSASGGGSSVSYYLNGSVAQGTIGGVAYKELSKVPVLGTGTDFTINADGYIASFLTDAGDPNLLEIPGGNWNFETYFSASSSGGTPTFYVELYKYDGSTFTLLASNSGAPEFIAFGTTLTSYFSTLAVPTTALALTDRLAIRYYVTHSGRTITLHTEDNHLCQVITTFTTGLTALNGLTAQVQNFAVGTSGSDFNIASASATHTFNLPTASGTNRGALSSADWSTFNAKQNALTLTTTGTSGAATLVGSTLNIPNYSPDLSGYVPTSRTITINGTTQDLSANRTFNVGTVTSVGLSSATSGVTIGSTPVTSSGTITLAIATASGSQQGLLSASDWTTFNNKQNALTNPVTGTGTTNYLAKFTGGTTIGNSQIFDNGTNVGIGTATPTAYTGFLNTSIGGAARGLLSIRNNANNEIGFLYNSGGNVFTLESLLDNLQLTSPASTLFVNGGSTRMTLNSSGNFGLGVTPSAWSLAGLSAMQIQNAGFFGYFNETGITQNAYFNSGWKYIGTGNATEYLQVSGEHRFFTAPSGTAGNAISFTQAMTLFSTSNLSIGSATDTGYRLFVNGNTYIRSGGNTSASFGLVVQDSSANNLFLVRNDGAATFSSSVTAAQFIASSSSNAAIITSTGTSGFGLLAVGSSGGARDIFLAGQSGFSNGFTVQYTGTEMRYGFQNGNVLIGTTSDVGTRLNVNGSIRSAEGNFQANITKAGSGVESANFLQLRLFGTNAIGDSLDIRYFNNNGNNIANISAILGGDNVAYGSLAFSTRNYFTDSMVEVMRINNRGNVGIGNTNPLQKLHITQAADTAYPTLGTGKGALFIAGDTNLYGLYVGINTNDGNTYFQAMRNNSATAYNITMQAAGGNVLIGTTTDNGAKLNVNGTIRTANPTGSTSDGWLLGRALVSGTSTPDRWIRVQIGNLYYDILAVYMGSV